MTERTQEIGLKKAIGARRRRILNQFLTEAAVLTSLGGLLGVIVGIIMACARVKKMKEKLRTVRFQAAAGSYQKENSLNVTESQDLFLYHTVTRTAREKSKSSDSGGSSTHSSSSGTTHGGGGGKF